MPTSSRSHRSAPPLKPRASSQHLRTPYRSHRKSRTPQTSQAKIPSTEIPVGKSPRKSDARAMVTPGSVASPKPSHLNPDAQTFHPDEQSINSLMSQMNLDTSGTPEQQGTSEPQFEGSPESGHPSAIVIPAPQQEFGIYQWLYTNFKSMLDVSEAKVHALVAKRLKLHTLQDLVDFGGFTTNAVFLKLGNQLLKQLPLQLAEFRVICMFIEHQFHFEGGFPSTWEAYLEHRELEISEQVTIFDQKAKDLKLRHSSFSGTPATRSPPYMSESPISKVSAHSKAYRTSDKASTAYHSFPPNMVFTDPSHISKSVHSGGDSGASRHSLSQNDSHFGSAMHPADLMDQFGDSVADSRSQSTYERRKLERDLKLRTASARARSNVSSDKLQWDGLRKSFPPFKQDLEGNLRRIGVGYLLKPDVLAWYKENGMGFPQIDEFWDKYQVSPLQVAFDVEYLYGILQSATKSRKIATILRHEATSNGLAAWLELQESYDFGGSKEDKSDDLEEALSKPYNRAEHGNVIKFLDLFEANMTEINGLGYKYYNNMERKKELLRKVTKISGMVTFVQKCEDDPGMSYEESLAYLRKKCYKHKSIIDARPSAKDSHMLRTGNIHDEPGPLIDPPKPMEVDQFSEDLYADAVATIQRLHTEMNPVQVYNALQSPLVRESLKIPNAIWRELEPQMRSKLIEIRNQVEAKRKKAQAEPTSKSGEIPSQYPTKANLMTQEDAVKQVNNLIQSAMEEDDCDDDVFLNMFMVKSQTCQMGGPDNVDLGEDLKVRAHLEYAEHFEDALKLYAISDGGADSCVVGKNSLVVAETGRYARLVGYDPKNTQSARIPIVTAYLKVRAQNGIPVLLRINEAPYNKGSPVTLLSEYQVRENNFVIDSVATKHRTSNGYGTQRLELSDLLHVPFEDRGGIMGFEILPISHDDVDEIDPKYDIFEITADRPWKPMRFRINHEVQKSTEVDPQERDESDYDPFGGFMYFDDQDDSETATAAFPSGFMDEFLSNMTYDELVDRDPYDPVYDGYPGITDMTTDMETAVLLTQLIQKADEKATDSTKEAKPRVRPWHRVVYKDADPKKIQPFLGWRPLDIVKKTLEHTTQLAKSSIRYPLRPHVKARNPWANVTRLNEVVSTDPKFANVPCMCTGHTGVQVFYGHTSHCITLYGISSKGQFEKRYLDFLREEGAPSALRRDNAKEENSEGVKNINRRIIVKDQFSEPHNQQQNTVEMAAIRWLVQATHKLLDMTGAPDSAWLLAMKYLAKLHDITYDYTLGMVPFQKRHGVTPDISAYLQHRFWDPILYYDHEASWPESKERSGRWVGVADNVGDVLTYWVVDDQTKQPLTRSVVRPFWGNRRVKWDPEFVKVPVKSTAHNGGDLKPPKETIEQLLDTAMDDYDKSETDPKPHPVIVTEFGNGQESVPSDSVLKPSKEYEPIDEGMDVTKPYVPKGKEDGYDGPSRLRYSDNPVPMDPEIKTWPRNIKKKTPRNTKYKTDYTPLESDPHDPLVKTEILKNERGIVHDRGAAMKKEADPTVRRSRRFAKGEPKLEWSKKLEGKGESILAPGKRTRSFKATRWVPYNTSQIFKMATTMAFGILLMPTHVMAKPGISFPSLTTKSLSLNPIVHEPTSPTQKVKKLRAYHAVLDRWNSLQNPDPLEARWALKKVVSDREIDYGTEGRKVFLKVQFQDGPKKWMTMDEVQLVDPYLAINHAINHDLKHKDEYSWVQEYLDFDEEVVEMVQAYKTSAKEGTKYKFGVEVPGSTKKALEIDRRNGNTAWQESIKLELDQIKEYEVFKVLPDHASLPPGYKRIPYHLVYDVKFDGRLKSRLVAGGHRSPEVPREDIFSGVVSMEAVRLGFLMAKLNGLKVCAGDVGNAFLHGKTREKLFIVAGPEFGPELAGKRLIIDKSLYGLKSSAARYHEHLSETLRKMGFRPSKADADLWMKKCSDGHYEYIARYVDDVIAFSKDPMAIMKRLKEKYFMKGVGTPRYYLGGDVLDLGEDWNKDGLFHAFSARTYLDNCLPKIADLLGCERLRKQHTPFDENYHAELDDSPLVSPERITIYRSLIGSANWVLTLGRFDIAYTLSTLSRYNNAPREGHMKALQRLFCYLNTYKDGQIILDDDEAPVRKEALMNVGFCWEEFYPDAVEQIPEDMPKPEGNLATITCYVDADHARDTVTRRSVTGIVLLINNTPVTWMSKRQVTVETSTYGSEMVASRIVVDLIIEHRYKLRMLGIKLEESSVMVGDNMSVVLNTTLPSSQLKKKHQSCNYHRIREMIAAKVVRYGHIVSSENVADVATKPLGRQAFHHLMKKYLFRIPPFTEKAKRDIQEKVELS